jgi:hypothetical protein
MRVTTLGSDFPRLWANQALEGDTPPIFSAARTVAPDAPIIPPRLTASPSSLHPPCRKSDGPQISTLSYEIYHDRIFIQARLTPA